jgi:AhpD family alkylhydroperoxidase
MAPDTMRTMSRLEVALAHRSRDPELLELVTMRASRINRCADCLDKDSEDARDRGKREQRSRVASAWREARFSSDRERAERRWCGALTSVADCGASDAADQQPEQRFADEEIFAPTCDYPLLEPTWGRSALTGGPLRVSAGSRGAFDAASGDRCHHCPLHADRDLARTRI